MDRNLTEYWALEIDRTLLDEQERTACEVALHAVENKDTGTLVWFTQEVLGLDAVNFVEYVAMALLEKSSGGEPYWRSASDPLAYVKTLATRARNKWKEHLRAGGDEDPDKLLSGFAVRKIDTELKPILHSGVDSNGVHVVETIGDEWWTRPKKRRFTRKPQKIGERQFVADGKKWIVPVYDSPEVTEVDIAPRRFANEVRKELHRELVNECLSLENARAWDFVAREFGFNDEEIVLLRLMILGVPRRKVGVALGWESERVERVWKRVYRKTNKSGVIKRVRELFRQHRLSRLETEVKSDTDRDQLSADARQEFESLVRSEDWFDEWATPTPPKQGC